MKLDLWDFFEGGVEFLEFQGELHWESLNLKGRKIKILEPIKYKGEVFSLDSDKSINISIDYVYGEDCNRCLKSTANNINTILFGRLVEGKKDFEDIGNEDNINNHNGKEDNGDEDILYYENNQLNLKDYIIEQIILSLPMKIICKNDCKGLCPKCGRNLNNSQCDCVYEDIDPRLEKLRDFFPKK